MELFSIASGSSGNCICIGSDDTHIMIDVGISGKRVESGMNDMDLTTSDMSAIFITHEHADHIQGLGVLARRHAIPIYGTRGTINAIKSTPSLGEIDSDLFHEIEADSDVTIGDIIVHPFRISHDAAEPVAYRMEHNGKKIAVVTDLGEYTDYTIDNIRGLDALLIEANHDVNMLRVGPYPYSLKQRIAGVLGHLSNEASGCLLSEVLHDDIGPILLGHLSKENNYPDLALESVRAEITLGESPYRGMDFDITVAPRDCPSQRVVV